ncbi:hypothetical protein H0A36_15665 [Endozoicomonas sp. SM1973]|uniref:Peptidase M50 n=1 Tax=Spartinivicinus marinus TaxID=2994442 RepID=A0A853IBL0_9GAMM|nr:biotin/lipoyl-binding protein [Spartinivicinus marinus]MCX4028433.1 hypothetical protein [Spartinivicinus marinus]NYZ67454.1 hypothetical protein [Spartinivicinus marinus]
MQTLHLRQDLQLFRGPENINGEPSWSLYDPAKNQYFRISWRTYNIIQQQFYSAPSTRNLYEGFQTTVDEINQVKSFLVKHQLVTYSHQRYSPSNSLPLTRLFKHYLCWQIPLWQPDRFINALLPIIKKALSPYLFYCWLLMCIVGSFWIYKQWDVFINSFSYLTQPVGILLFILCLLFTKFAHELGHAFAAAYFQCRTNSIGIAIILLWPRFYTDTSHSWRLVQRKQKMIIDGAGVLTEFFIAGLMIFLWHFLPTGPLQNCAAFIATSGLVLTLVINLNPFMRFDGYYILSDWLAIDNLQTKAFNCGKWFLRKLCLGLTTPCPIKIPINTIHLLVIYAWLTWIFRLVVFFSIALLVYSFFFKALGIILFLLEIYWLILRPIFSELKQWWQLKQFIKKPKQLWVPTIISLFILVLLCYPFSWSFFIPALYLPQQSQQLYAFTTGKVTAIHVEHQQSVSAGTPILSLENPLLNHQIHVSQLKIAHLKEQLRQTIGTNQLLFNRTLLLKQLTQAKQQLNGLQQKRGLLDLKAPYTGTLYWHNPAPHIGQWVNSQYALGQLITSKQVYLTGYSIATTLNQLSDTKSGIFYPEIPELSPIRVKLNQVSAINSPFLEHAFFQSIFGGPIPVRLNQNNQAVPEQPIYPVTFQAIELASYPPRMINGTVRIDGSAQSLITRIYRQILAVLIRESGF